MKKNINTIIKNYILILVFIFLNILLQGNSLNKNFSSEWRYDSIHFAIPPYNQKICLVTVDTALTKNVIVWEKTPGHNIKFFKIYKENIATHIFDSIGYKPYDSLSYFIDIQSYPKIRAAKYRISTVDSNGIESSLSPIHQTIQLNISKGTGWNFDLTWTPYIGFPVYYYRIWRWSLSSGWIKIDSVQGGTFTYNDSPPPSLVYYFVETVSPHPCNVSKAQTNYNTSRSNRANTSIFTGDIEIFTLNSNFKLYPNPFSKKTTLEYYLDNQAFISIEIYSIIGQKTGTIICERQIAGTYKYQLDSDNYQLKSGIYFIRFTIDNNFVGIRKLIVDK